MTPNEANSTGTGPLGGREQTAYRENVVEDRRVPEGLVLGRTYT